MFSIRLFFILIWTISVYGDALQEHKGLEFSGDILQIAIPATALVTTFGLKDFEGSKEFLRGFAATGVTVYGLKYFVNEKRPSHGKHSFPSGHAAMAFLGSGFVH